MNETTQLPALLVVLGGSVVFFFCLGIWAKRDDDDGFARYPNDSHWVDRAASRHWWELNWRYGEPASVQGPLLKVLAEPEPARALPAGKLVPLLAAPQLKLPRRTEFQRPFDDAFRDMYRRLRDLGFDISE